MNMKLVTDSQLDQEITTFPLFLEMIDEIVFKEDVLMDWGCCNSPHYPHPHSINLILIIIEKLIIPPDLVHHRPYQ